MTNKGGNGTLERLWSPNKPRKRWKGNQRVLGGNKEKRGGGHYHELPQKKKIDTNGGQVNQDEGEE